MTPYPIRPFTADEFPRVGRVIAGAFLESYREEDIAVLQRTLELDRGLAAFDGDRPVATAGAHTFELTVPGTVAPAAGVTIVTVDPTYRRQGLLSALMTRQLGDLAEGGEAVAVLWASESSIYRRYGYAVASYRTMLEVDRAAAGLVADAPVDPELRLTIADPGEVTDDLAKLYDELRPQRPGFVTRDEAHWADTLNDPEHARDGALAMQALLVHGPAGDLRAYALHRISPGHDGLTSTATVRVEEIQANDAAAYAACWRFLSTVDLTAKVTSRQLPMDAPLFAMLADPRRARAIRNDALWVRLVRVGDALAQRRYAAPVDLVLDVRDERCPHNAGRWHLTGDEQTASCERTTATADLELDVRVLASAYLGESSLTAHAQAGYVTERREGALRRLGAAMSWEPRPWCPHSF
ncbi:MAG: GNAT family N-acetyltransferase [Streptosporangiales bacterium]|nr:GNAT family N-acetyltransferase [Streptosporangiales bacterium]